MKSGTEFTGDTILNELYINPYLYSVEQFLRAEDTEQFIVTIGSPSLTYRAYSVPSQVRQRDNQMALNSLSLREAELYYPHLFEYI